MFAYDEDLAIEPVYDYSGSLISLRATTKQTEISEPREQITVSNSQPYLIVDRQAAPLEELRLERDSLTDQTKIKGSFNKENLTNPSEIFKALGDLFSDNFLNGLKEGVKNVGYEAKRLAIAQDFFAIKRVIFSKPKTIVLWEDGTKTIVSCSLHDIYDKRVALMYAMMQKLFGNSTRMRKFFDQYCEAADYLDPEVMSDVVDDFTERRKKYEQLIAEKEAAKIANTDPSVE